MAKPIPSKPIVTSATRRLQQDWLELVTEPVRGVSATPVNDDLFTWHANITPSSGPYRNIIFHLHLLFPETYPSKPPTVQLCTTFPHPNIFNWGQSNGYPYICLDMLKEYTSSKPYTGWTTAYTVQAILMQLSAFFFDASVPQEYGGNRQNMADQKSIDTAIERARIFTCTCGHTHNKPYPMIQKHKQEQQQQKDGITVTTTTSESESGVSHFTVLATVLIHHIFSFLPTSTLRHLNHTCHIFRTVIDRYHMCIHRERICFHTKRSWEQEILGVGVVVIPHPTGAGIASLSTPCLDLFSRSSYDEGLRVGVWKESFTYHLPLLINTSHASRSFSLIERLFQTWCGRTFTPHMALNMCATLMNTMVVDFMKECEPSKQDEYGYGYEMIPIPVTLHTSEKALLGYISYHHMLLGFVQRYPVIRDIANKAVDQFHRDATYRTKEHTPNLGEFLVYLSISDLSWHDIAISFLIEMMDRDVRWMIQKRPELSKTGGTYAPTLCQRIRWSYHYAETGKKLLMFQTFFLRCVRPDGIPFNLNTTLSSYNRSLGHPPSHLAPRLQRACRSIMTCNHWDTYFDSIAVKRLSARSLFNLLTMSVIRSSDKRYHGNHHIGKETDKSMNTTVGCVCDIMEGDRNKAIPILNGVVLCRCLNNDAYLRLAQGVVPNPVVIAPTPVKEEIKQEISSVPVKEEIKEVVTPTPLTVSIASPTASPVSSPMSTSTASPVSSMDVTPVTTPVASPVKATSTPVSTPSPVARIETPAPPPTSIPTPIIIKSSRPGGPRIVSLRQKNVEPEMVSEFGPFPGCDCTFCTEQRLEITRRSSTRKPTGTGIPIPVMTPEELRAHMAQYHTERKVDDAIFPALGANITETKEYIPEGREPIQPLRRTWQSHDGQHQYHDHQRQYPSRQQRDGQQRRSRDGQQRSYQGGQRSYNHQSSRTDRHVRSPVNNVRYTYTQLQRSPAAAAAHPAQATSTRIRTPPRSRSAAAVPPSPPSNRFLVLSADE